MRETSKSIREWGDETFGEVKNLTTLVARARRELEELEDALNASGVNGVPGTGMHAHESMTAVWYSGGIP